jgi:hypothetical protein
MLIMLKIKTPVSSLTENYQERSISLTFEGKIQQEKLNINGKNGTNGQS